MKRLVKRLTTLWHLAPPDVTERVHGYEAAWPVPQAIPVQASPPEPEGSSRKETEAQVEAR